jgi:hypothetical protein
MHENNEQNGLGMLEIDSPQLVNLKIVIIH